MGPHIYDGKWIGEYKLELYKVCYESNWDGIAPVYEKVFERHLEQNGIAIPMRNKAGWHPRGR